MIIPLILLLFEAAFAFFLLYRTGALPRFRHVLAAAALIGAAFILRWLVLPVETPDYRDFLSNWVSWFADNGGFAALKTPVGNYNIPYLYFLAAFSYLPVKDLYLIKALSIFFDVLLAWAVCLIVSLFTENSRLRIGAFSLVLLWPTVLLNGAYWGQCDSSYTALALLGIWCALSGKPVRSMICIALSFSFKLQAVFLMPLWAVFLIRGDIRWKHLPLFPFTYVVTVLPAVIAGRPFLDTVTLYFHQMDSIGTGLNYNSPSVFSFWDHKAPPADPAFLTNLGIALAFVFMAAVLLVCLLCRKRLTAKSVLLAGALLATGIPFLLPRMHDRYFFPADILTLCLAFLLPETVPCALLTVFASFLAYYAYLNMRYLLLMKYGAMALILSLLLLTAAFCMALRNGGSASPERLENNA